MAQTDPAGVRRDIPHMPLGIDAGVTVRLNVFTSLGHVTVLMAALLCGPTIIFTKMYNDYFQKNSV